MRSTHTYAVLKISPEAHAEIKAKLLAAGYSHALDGETIDMQGIAVEPVNGPERPTPNPVYAETQKRIGYGDIHLVREGDYAVVKIEHQGREVEVIREMLDGWFSHNVTSVGIDAAIERANEPDYPEGFQNVRREGDKVFGEIQVSYDPKAYVTYVDPTQVVIDEAAFNRP